MNSPVDSIALAERRVAEQKAAASAEYRALEINVRQTVSSPQVLAGVLLGAIAIAYLVLGATGKSKPNAVGSRSGLWAELLRQTAQLVVPLLGTLKAAQEARAARKPVARATGTPEVPPGGEGGLK